MELPRFVSLKSNDESKSWSKCELPIKLKFIQQNLPVEIIDEFDVWRKVRDNEDNIGWLHKSLIKGDRFIFIDNKSQKFKNIYNIPNGNIIGIVKNNNILKLESCLEFGV